MLVPVLRKKLGVEDWKSCPEARPVRKWPEPQSRARVDRAWHIRVDLHQSLDFGGDVGSLGVQCDERWPRTWISP